MIALAEKRLTYGHQYVGSVLLKRAAQSGATNPSKALHHPYQASDTEVQVHLRHNNIYAHSRVTDLRRSTLDRCFLVRPPGESCALLNRPNATGRSRYVLML